MQSALARDVAGLLEQIRARCKQDAVVGRLSDQIEVRVRAEGDVVSAYDWRPFKLTKYEARLVDLLYSRMGRMCSRQSIMDAMYYDAIDDEPADKIIDILVCHIRKKLALSPYEIVAEYGEGYSLRLAYEMTPAGIAKWQGMVFGPKCWRIVSRLLKNPHRHVPAYELAEVCGTTGSHAARRLVTNCLRPLLAKSAYRIVSKHNYGYKLVKLEN